MIAINAYIGQPTGDYSNVKLIYVQDIGINAVNRKRLFLVEQKLLQFVDAFHQYVMDRVLLSFQHTIQLLLC